ncbi:hypothetical protein [Paraburkholderia piptadeniae]|uniref:hypothetical protein n=1 Tax=Paraburkholderia piptadeniae TaxID=1701573 RepID=UPI00135750CE|nr:hypothetical protein [Paraburkholderia piptadeniae]
MDKATVLPAASTNCTCRRVRQKKTVSWRRFEKTARSTFHVQMQQESCRRLIFFVAGARDWYVTSSLAASCRLASLHPASHNAAGDSHMHSILILPSRIGPPIVSRIAELA